jgi:hypothetical protein
MYQKTVEAARLEWTALEMPGVSMKTLSVDEVGSDPLASGHTSREWGTVVVTPDGTVVIDRDPCSESV